MQACRLNKGVQECGVVGGEVEAEAGGGREVEVSVGDFVAGLPEEIEE